MNNQEFNTVIKSNTSWKDINFKELGQYNDLIFLFVKRNFTTRYKQTILGPAWIIISPLVSTFISTFVFGTIAGIPSDGVPYFLFYMCGSCAWSFFSGCLSSTSSTFTGNAGIFGKVYFPRLVMPISTVITGFIDFMIRFVMFLLFWIYYYFSGASICFTNMLWMVPVLILMMGALGLGCGIIISSLTTKYRDLNVLVGFGVSLWMYITPVIYTTTNLSPKLRNLCMLNPMTPIIEMFRNAFLGVGDISFMYLGISGVITLIVLFIGLILFNKVEKTFMDTV